MPKQLKENAYAASPYVAAPTTIDGSYAGKLVRANWASLTLSFVGFQPLQWVDLLNIGTVPVPVSAADGINRPDVTGFELYPDQRSRVVYMAPEPPCWGADIQYASSRGPNQLLAVSDDASALEGRGDSTSIGMDLVLEGDGLAGYWRAPWPGVLTAVNAAARAGTASILVQKTRASVSVPVLGFAAPVGLQVAPEAVLSGESFAAGDRFQVAVSGYDGLEPDEDGIRGVLVSLDVTRVAQ